MMYFMYSKHGLPSTILGGQYAFFIFRLTSAYRRHKNFILQNVKRKRWLLNAAQIYAALSQNFTSVSSIKTDDDGSLFDIFSWPCCRPGSISTCRNNQDQNNHSNLRETTDFMRRKRVEPYDETK